MKLPFSKTEAELYERTGRDRNATNRQAANSDAAVEQSLRIDVIGAAGELFVAKALNRTWGGRLYSFEDWLAHRHTTEDVVGLEVKTSTHPKCRLFIPVYQAAQTKLDTPYVLVRLFRAGDGTPWAELKGWAYGREILEFGAIEEYRPGRACYYLPKANLRSVESLQELCAGNLVAKVASC